MRLLAWRSLCFPVHPSAFILHPSLSSSFSLHPSSLEFKHLQPIVPRVHRDDFFMPVDRDTPRVGELARVVAAAAPGLEAAAGLLVDQLHPVIAELAHDQIAVAVLVETVRIPE